MTISATAYSRFFRSSVIQAHQARPQPPAAATAQFQPLMTQPVATQPVTTQPVATQTQTATSQSLPTPDANGRLVFPVMMPAKPDLPPATPVRHNPAAAPVIDPVTGTRVPRGYDSWAQFNEEMATIAARQSAMYDYFMKINAVIDQVQGIIAATETPPQE